MKKSLLDFHWLKQMQMRKMTTGITLIIIIIIKA
jgi:hypothetical protein